MTEHSFDINIAMVHGVNAALVCRHLQYWINYNRAHDKHLHEGRTWTYFSVKAFTEIFPYLTAKQVRRALDVLLKAGIIIKGNFNQKKYDRTCWYAFVDEKAFALQGKSKSPTGHEHLPAGPAASDHQGGAIPNTKTNTNTDRKTNTSIERKPTEVLALDIEIADKCKFWTEQLRMIFFLGARETRTFAAITKHMVTQCQCGKLKPSIFTEAVEWAKQARASGATNKKGLLCQKLIKESGYKSPQKLLPSI